MRFPRSAGTLLHPTSLPGDFGIGDFGQQARTLIHFLVETGQSIWQVLPLTPTGYGNSPYASYSAFAGNVYLISPDILLEKGLVPKEVVDEGRIKGTTKVDYDHAFEFKDQLFKIAADTFFKNAGKSEMEAYESFKQQHNSWLDDYVLFMVCFLNNDKKPWNLWDEKLASRDEKALKQFADQHEDEIRLQYWLQFEFYNQWLDLKNYANEQGIRIIGDIPIFVDHNSADVWANPEFFEVDDKGNRKLVAGVPPDYFSETGQLWGNPLYKWDAMEKDGFSWWVARFKHMFFLCDAIRVDHFRGFEAYWEVKATEKTAIKGKWVKGPGYKLFDKIMEECGEVPMIAEDLGVMTPEVEALRDHYNFPGMKIIQFAFDADSKNAFLPHNYSRNSVTYSGTHDNDTSIGWYNAAPEHERHHARTYCKSDGSEINWDFIRLGLLSVADQAIFPLQDYMNLDTEHRVNFPGTVDGNWLWRYTDDMLAQVDANRIRKLVDLGNRLPDKN
jgi:4-alpha-glucanotransferase